jgi:tetratricopeptide (TPR) repeat protein
VILQIKITRLLLASLAPTTIVWLSACTGIDHAANCNHFLAKASSASDAHNYAGAQEALSKAAQEAAVSDDAAQTPRVLREQASTFLCQHNPGAAESTARQLIKIYDGRAEEKMSTTRRLDLAEDRSRARIILSDALLAQKRPDDAVAVLEKAQKEMESVPGDSVLLANVSDHYTAALMASGRAGSSPGINPEADFLCKSEADGLADQAIELDVGGHYKEAIVLLKKAEPAAIKSGFADPYLRVTSQLACQYYMLNHATEAYEQAIKAVKKARSADNVTPKVKSSAFAMLALTSAQPNEVAEALREAASISPDAALDAMYNVAILNSQRPFAAKVRECDLAWSLAPQASGFGGVKALCVRYMLFFGNKSMHAPAIAWFLEHAKSPSLRPEERMICYDFAGRILENDNRLAECKQNLRQAVQLRQQLKESDLADQPGGAFRLAQEYTTLGRPQEAIAAAQHALTLYSANISEPPASLTLIIARAYSTEHEYTKAIENYDKALVLCRKGNLPYVQTVLAERAQLAAQIKH